jgi:transposase
MKYEIPEKSDLYDYHYNKGKSIQELTRIYNVSRPVISNWFKKYNMKPINGLKRKNIPSKEELYNYHHINKKTIQDLSEIYKTSPSMVKKWLKEYDIERLFIRNKRKANPCRKELYNYHHNHNLTLKEISEIYEVSDVLVGLWFKEFDITINYKPSGTSAPENEIKNILNSYGFNFATTRKVLNGKEIDLYDENLKFGIEYCGLNWHSEDKLGKKYHLNKLNSCKEKNIKLITIFEDEWLQKKDIVISVLKSKLGVSEKIYGRKTVCKMIDKSTSRKFLNENHLQGSPNSIKYSFGLFYKDNLVAVLTYGNHHRKSNELVLNRLCFLKDKVIIGGSEKIFKYSLEFVPRPFISWSDNRWSDGNVYKKLGFKIKKILPPDYSYFKNQKRIPKQTLKKSLTSCPKNITEYEWNQKNGYRRIWDCGKISWEYK